MIKKREKRAAAGRQTVRKAEDNSLDSIAIRKKNRMRRRRNFFSVLLIIVLLFATYFVSGLDYFVIKEIHISDNSHFSNEDVVRIAGAKTGENMFRILLTTWKKNLLKDPYIRNARVSRQLPDAVKITVEEREEKYAVANGKGFIIIDDQGIALKQASQPGIYIVIDGIKLDKITLGQKIKDESMLQNEDKALALLSEFENNAMEVQKIIFADNSVTVQIFDNLMCKTEYNILSSNLHNLKAALSDMDTRSIKRGTIRIAQDGSMSFSPQI